MYLSDLLADLPEAAQLRLPDLPVSVVTDDSRLVTKESVFVAIKGTRSDGHDFLPEVFEKEPAAIISNRVRPLDYDGVWVQVFETRPVLGALAAKLAGDPSEKLALVGVTGTNGKTTTTFFVRHLLRSIGVRAGMIGTVENFDGVEILPATHTTPAAPELQELLTKMVDRKCQAAVMEVSSHGLEQGRVSGCRFRVGVFLNLTQDHLDYHGTMDEYFEAKKLLFEQMARQGGGGTAVISIDCPYGRRLVEEMKGRLEVVTFGERPESDLRFSNIKPQFYSQEFSLEARGRQHLVRMPLTGRFNVVNAVAAIGAATAVGFRIREMVQHIQNLPQTPGRLECVGGDAAPVFVDYAHTPDALEKVCRTLRELRPRRLITVFGCGGDRDKTKRPLMAKAASEESDFCFVTSDNPRGEDPGKIIDDILPGMVGDGYEVELDRRAAILAALRMSRARDIVLIAGKGHENYQEVKGEKSFFDDRLEARKGLQITKRERDELREQRREENLRNRGQRPDGSPPSAGPRRDDRPPRNFDDRGPRRDREERPRRDFGKRPPRRDDSRGPRRDDDRPRRDFHDRRPRRDGDDRPPRRDSSDRPPRRFDHRGPRRDDDRPRRNFDDRRPRRDGDDRPPRRDSGDRPPRRFDNRGPRREGGDRPRRDFDSRGPRPGRSDRPRYEGYRRRPSQDDPPRNPDNRDETND